MLLIPQFILQRAVTFFTLGVTTTQGYFSKPLFYDSYVSEN